MGVIHHDYGSKFMPGMHAQLRSGFIFWREGGGGYGGGGESAPEGQVTGLKGQTL